MNAPDPRSTSGLKRTPSLAEAQVATLLPHPAQAERRDWTKAGPVRVDLDWNAAQQSAL
ncbi:MAG: hypothetical protein WA966_02715 [Ornithinimicrobium sp.]